MASLPIDRRSFLKLLGLCGAATGLGQAGLALARGGTAAGPVRRLILLSHCHGWPRESWRLKIDGKDDATPWEVDLKTLPKDQWSKQLAPLYDIRSRLLPIDGMSLATAELDADGNRHDTGFVQTWTGNWVDFSTSPAKARSPSVDQLVAAQISGANQLPSLELAVHGVQTYEPGRPVCYAPNGKQIPMEGDPLRVWQRVFGPSQKPDPLAAHQRRVLDFSYNEFKAMSVGLEQNHRERLNSHYELLRALGQRLQGLANLQCKAAPGQPTHDGTFDTRFDAMAELISAAFACDVTRVVSLSLGEMRTSDFGWEKFTDNVHKGIAHGIFDSPLKHDAMSDYMERHAQQVARLVKKLESIPDVGGGSVMDNTLIVWGSELANGWHGYREYCPMIIGGSWHFKTGRYMHKPHTTPIEMLVPAQVNADGWSKFAGLPHQHLLVSTAQAMGLQIDHVGLSHTQGQRGDKVNLRGPVPGLT
jgi:hypothetical protein